MPETSIVVKSTDRYSDTIKKMASVTKSFQKDMDKMESALTSLSKNKVTLRMDLSKAKLELKAAEKQFDATHDAADGLALELAQANYDNIARNLKAVTNAARETEKAISKVENSAGDGGGGVGGKISKMTKGFATGQIGQMMASSPNGAAGWALASAIGQPTASFVSEVVSGAITGTAAGAIAGVPGMAVGGVIGLASGAISGKTKIAEARDDAFKSYVRDAYERADILLDYWLRSGCTAGNGQNFLLYAVRRGRNRGYLPEESGGDDEQHAVPLRRPDGHEQDSCRLRL